jgi:uncharacterized protein (DUF1501 family)
MAMATTRRQFLLAGLGAAAVPMLTRLTWARAARSLAGARDGRILVIVELGGGNDGLNTVVPFGDERYVDARPTLKIAPSELLTLSDGLGLRKELVGLKQRFDRGQFALVQGVGYPKPDRSHFRSTDIWHTASLEPESARTGWIGRLCECEGVGGAQRTPALMIGSERVPLLLVGDQATAPQVDDVARFHLPTGPEDAGAAARRAALVRLAGDAAAGPASDDVLGFLKGAARSTQANVLQIEAATQRSRSAVAYPDSALAQELRLAAQLIAGGFDCTAYFVRHSGYDTHAFQAEAHALLLRELGGALTAFLADVEAARVLDRIVVLVYSEFGRRFAENGSKGTDHGAAAPVFVLGGGVKGGLVGAHPSLADLDEEKDVKFTTDFRRIYATLLQEWLGVAPKPVLGADFAKLPLFA